MILENPYNTVRGRKTDTTSSVDAVRSLLTIVPCKDERDHDDNDDDDDDDDNVDHTDRETKWMDRRFLGAVHHDFLSPPPPPSSSQYDELDASWRGDRQPRTTSQFKPSTAETASQIAEGTVRALRDLCLDEAVELHLALRFWTERWERPVLSWLEAGPQGEYSFFGNSWWIVMLEFASSTACPIWE